MKPTQEQAGQSGIPRRPSCLATMPHRDLRVTLPPALQPLALWLALALLAVCLVACQAPGSAADQGKKTSGNLVLSTAVGGSPSATPTLPPLFISVWTSTMAPGTSDSLTIYVLCMVQDPALGELVGPAVGLPVRLRLSSPINQSYTATTSRDGLAQVRVSFTGVHPGQPVIVEVAATWHGATYRGQTVFMPGAGGAPSPTPSPASTPTPASSPTETPEQEPTLPPQP